MLLDRRPGPRPPSGVELAQDAKDKLRRHGAKFEWSRLGLLFEDFDRFDLVFEIPVKRTDSRSARYLAAFGDVVAELDALPPGELRQRVRAVIEQHINRDEWERLARVEARGAAVAGNGDAQLVGGRAGNGASYATLGTTVTCFGALSRASS